PWPRGISRSTGLSRPGGRRRRSPWRREPAGRARDPRDAARGPGARAGPRPGGAGAGVGRALGTLPARDPLPAPGVAPPLARHLPAPRARRARDAPGRAARRAGAALLLPGRARARARPGRRRDLRLPGAARRRPRGGGRAGRPRSLARDHAAAVGPAGPARPPSDLAAPRALGARRLDGGDRAPRRLPGAGAGRGHGSAGGDPGRATRAPPPGPPAHRARRRRPGRGRGPGDARPGARRALPAPPRGLGGPRRGRSARRPARPGVPPARGAGAPRARRAAAVPPAPRRRRDRRALRPVRAARRLLLSPGLRPRAPPPEPGDAAPRRRDRGCGRTRAPVDRLPPRPGAVQVRVGRARRADHAHARLPARRRRVSPPRTRLGPLVREHLRGGRPPTITLLQALLAGASPDDVRAAVGAAAAGGGRRPAAARRLAELRDALDPHWPEYVRLAAMLGDGRALGPEPDGIAGWATLFDVYAARSEAGSVAGYSRLVPVHPPGRARGTPLRGGAPPAAAGRRFRDPELRLRPVGDGGPPRGPRAGGPVRVPGPRQRRVAAPALGRAGVPSRAAPRAGPASRRRDASRSLAPGLAAPVASRRRRSAATSRHASRAATAAGAPAAIADAMRARNASPAPTVSASPSTGSPAIGVHRPPSRSTAPRCASFTTTMGTPRARAASARTPPRATSASGSASFRTVTCRRSSGPSGPTSRCGPSSRARSGP